MTIKKRRYEKIKYLNSQRRSVTWDDIVGDSGAASSSGVRVTEKTAMTYAAIYRAVDIISSTVAKLPLSVFLKTGDDNQGNKKDIQHPAYKILRRKSSKDVTAYDFKKIMQSSVLLYGNGYAKITRNNFAEPEELLWIHPNDVNPVRENGQLLYKIYLDNNRSAVKEEDMLHIKTVSLDGITGISAIEYGANTFGSGLAMQQYGTSFFKNGAVPLVWLSTDQVLQEDAQKRLRDGWNKMHKGSANAHKVGVGEQGLKPTILTVSAKDSQLIESRTFSIKEIATWFGLPAHMLGDDTKTSHSSLEQENQSFLDNGIDPHLSAWEAQCYDKLLREEEKDNETHDIEFNRNALVKADIKSRFAAYAISIPNGILSPNEVRAKENMNPRPGGDEFLSPMNMNVSGEDSDDQDDDPEVDETQDEEDERKKRIYELFKVARLDAFKRCAKRIQNQIDRASDKKSKREKIKSEMQDYVRDALDPARKAWDIYAEYRDELYVKYSVEADFWEEFDKSPDDNILGNYIQVLEKKKWNVDS